MGYIGPKQVTPILLGGLEKLEYRGYDSAGIAVVEPGGIKVRKKKGRLSNLVDSIADERFTGVVGIGHTRWATHGAPSDINAHPHCNKSGTIALIHNGIIENFQKIKEWLSAKGYSFVSQTDTEMIVHLVDYYYKGDLLDAVQNAVHHLVGTYALCVVCSDSPDEIIVVRKDSPLVLGVGNGENYVASDVPALLEHTRDVYFLNDGEMAKITRDSIEIMDCYGIPIEREVFHVDWDATSTQKGGYPHYMLKEIHEEPKALHDTLFTRLSDDGALNISDLGLSDERIKSLERILIVACGTAYHAGLVGKYTFEKLLGIPVDVDVASEFRYRNPPIKQGDLVIVVSQSGETIDTRAAMRLAQEKGATALAITNVVGSVISREADAVMYTLAGPEISVASTKAYVTQLMCLDILALAFAHIRGDIDETRYQYYIEELKKIPDIAEQSFAVDEKVKRAAHQHSNLSDVYFFGRNIDSALALESSLKLKEISYIHSEAFAAGELKHGPIALIEDGTLVIAIATQSALFEKTASNIKEVKARDATVLALCPERGGIIEQAADETIILPAVDDLFAAMAAVIPMQLFAYYCAVERGLDVDKPRNLAKSVTVE